MYRFPRLPVPDLEQTLRALRSFRDAVGESEYPYDRAKVERAQELLLQRAENCIGSWLEHWWLEDAYLSSRLPLPVHSSITALLDVPLIGQLEQAARVIRASLLYYRKVAMDFPLEAEDQDRKLFSGCRIPYPTTDLYQSQPDSRHIVVFHRSRYWAVEVLDHLSHPVSEGMLLQALADIVNEPTELGITVGIATSMTRDSWAELRGRLWQRSWVNRESLKLIESALFVVCLEDSQPDDLFAAAVWEYPLPLGNRWYDKVLQWVVFPEGQVGLNTEHSVTDGACVSRLLDSVVAYEGKDPPPNKGEDRCFVQPLTWELVAEEERLLQEAALRLKDCAEELGLDHEQIELEFEDFGAQFLKGQGVSPDSFVQVVVQIAYHRTHHTLVPTYEAVSTAHFYHGRTEVCRSPTPAIRDLLEGFTREQLLAAIEEHKASVNLARQGMGIDRHIKGLNKMAETEVLPEETNWILSTSQLGEERYRFSFGAVVPDGYGICYRILPQRIRFVFSAKRSSAVSDLAVYTGNMVECLHLAGRMLSDGA